MLLSLWLYPVFYIRYLWYFSDPELHHWNDSLGISHENGEIHKRSGAEIKKRLVRKAFM